MTSLSTRCEIVAALVIACATIAGVAQTTATAHGDRVAGMVVSALDEHPLPHATVTLKNYKSERVLATADTDEEGHYSFENVAAGKYNLSAITRGYFSAAYDEHEGYSTAIVTGAGLVTDALTLRLTPLASLAVRIVDEAGDPVQNAMVQLYREDPDDGGKVGHYRGGSSSADGLFEFSRLTPGRYYLSASGNPWYAVHPQGEQDGGFQYRTAISPAVDVAYPMTFYPHVFDSAEASPIELHGGEQSTLDMTLAAQHAETLAIRLPPGQRPGSMMQPQLVQSVFGMEQPVMQQQVSFTDKEQLISGIPPGRYKLKQQTPNGAPVGESNVDLTSGPASVEVAPAGALATVSLVVRSANGAPFSSQTTQIALHPDGSSFGMPVSNISDKGVATFSGVPPGTYRFTLYGPNHPFFPTRLVVGGHEAAGNKLQVSGSGTLLADLTVTADTVDVDGFALRDGKAAAGSMMVLVPAGKDTSETLFRRDQSDLDGSFLLAGVVPGNYILVAIDNGWGLHWNDANTLIPYLIHGVPVVVTANGKAAFHVADKVSSQPR